MSLSELVYSPLKEEGTKLTGWSKSTIDYVLNNKKKVYTSIRGIAKIYNKVLQYSDIEDVYMEIINYLYRSDDYNIAKAYERSSSDGAIVSLEGYVHSCIKFCVIRYVTDDFKEESRLVRDKLQDDEGKEISLFDTLADTKNIDVFNSIGYQLESICKSYEHQRYAFGPDIFQIWFVRLQTIIYNKQNLYMDILNILGISKSEIIKVEKRANNDGAMVNIAKAITLIGAEEAVKILRDYTYSADKIEQVIKNF